MALMVLAEEAPQIEVVVDLLVQMAGLEYLFCRYQHLGILEFILELM